MVETTIISPLSSVEGSVSKKVTPSNSNTELIPFDSMFELMDGKDLSANQRKKLVANMWGTGYTTGQIAKAAGITTNQVRHIIKSPKVTEHINEIQRELDEHFKLLKHKVVDTIRCAMDSPDLTIALAGAATYVKVHERLYGGQKEDMTAEDVVKKLLTMGSNGS